MIFEFLKKKEIFVTKYSLLKNDVAFWRFFAPKKKD
jgi:hypothetical protein